MSRGAAFGDLTPRLDVTGQVSTSFRTMGFTSRGIENAVIQPMTPFNSFRMGQQVIFWLGVRAQNTASPPTNWANKVRLKPWWARPNMEFRQAFVPPKPIDYQVFNLAPQPPPVTPGALDNRYVWVPSPKRLDVTPWDTPPPSLPPPRHSDSLMLDDIWTLQLQPANDLQFQGNFPPNQLASRWVSILYPAMGYALGFTWDYELEDPDQVIDLQVNLTWVTGTFGGASGIQESIG